MIRPAKGNDAARLVEIYNEAVINSTATFDINQRSVDIMREQILEHEGKYIFLVEEQAGEILGYASLSVYRPRKAFEQSVELSIYLKESAKGQGIGTRFMQELLSFAQKREDIHTILSLITADNKASIGLHEKFGFTFCGQIKEVGYKFDRYLDLNLYQRFV